MIFTQGSSCSEIYGTEGLLPLLATPKVKVVDTVGAGDSFTATYVMTKQNGASVTEVHRSAVDVAVFVCSQSGAVNLVTKSLKATTNMPTRCNPAVSVKGITTTLLNIGKTTGRRTAKDTKLKPDATSEEGD